jgi:Predicted permease
MQKKISRLFRLSLVLLAAAALVYLLYKVREILLTFGMAALIAYVCFRPVLAIEKRGLRRTWAILLFYAVLLAFLALALWVTIPIMIKEIGELARLLPQYAQQAQQLSGAVQNSAMPDRIGSMIGDNMASIENAVYDSLRNFFKQPGYIL